MSNENIRFDDLKSLPFSGILTLGLIIRAKASGLLSQKLWLLKWLRVWLHGGKSRQGMEKPAGLAFLEIKQCWHDMFAYHVQ